ncbi:hypothetical protein AB0K00_47970 [Dactylosporangium sp. NPDC049525]|uniref:hypothetical protein n=1 Tax=Dactylosporangium sp. NPDC049525 TaxID=3154730 RepID=UPI0034132315
MTLTVLASGHLIDTPDRPVPRFPQRAAGDVARLVGQALDDWHVGPGSVLVCGGARGADLIAAEAALARGAAVTLCLAMPVAEFEASSVALPDTDWSDRFHRVMQHSDVRVLADAGVGDDRFSQVNQWMADLVKSLDDRPCVLLVWDGGTGDGPGGTADMVTRLGYDVTDPHVRIIDPTTL